MTGLRQGKQLSERSEEGGLSREAEAQNEQGVASQNREQQRPWGRNKRGLVQEQRTEGKQRERRVRRRPDQAGSCKEWDCKLKGWRILCILLIRVWPPYLHLKEMPQTDRWWRPAETSQKAPTEARLAVTLEREGVGPTENTPLRAKLQNYETPWGVRERIIFQFGAWKSRWTLMPFGQTGKTGGRRGRSRIPM